MNRIPMTDIERQALALQQMPNRQEATGQALATDLVGLPFGSDLLLLEIERHKAMKIRESANKGLMSDYREYIDSIKVKL